MNILEQLKEQLKPVLTQVELTNGAVLYVHKPRLSDFDKCNNVKGTIIHCVCSDESGYHCFSDGPEEGKVDINDIDTSLANELFQKCVDLWGVGDSKQEEVEKK